MLEYHNTRESEDMFTMVRFVCLKHQCDDAINLMIPELSRVRKRLNTSYVVREAMFTYTDGISHGPEISVCHPVSWPQSALGPHKGP